MYNRPPSSSLLFGIWSRGALNVSIFYVVVQCAAVFYKHLTYDSTHWLLVDCVALQLFYVSRQSVMYACNRGNNTESVAWIGAGLYFLVLSTLVPSYFYAVQPMILKLERGLAIVMFVGSLIDIMLGVYSSFKVSTSTGAIVSALWTILPPAAIGTALIILTIFW